MGCNLSADWEIALGVITLELNLQRNNLPVGMLWLIAFDGEMFDDTVLS